MNQLLRWFNWFNRARLSLLIGSGLLALGAVSPWYRLPTEVLDTFGINFAWSNAAKLFSLWLALFGLAFTFLLSIKQAPRLLIWSALIAALLFPCFVVNLTPEVNFIAKAYYEQAETVSDHVQENFPEVQAQWKQNILLAQTRPTRSVFEFNIKDSRFFQMASWDYLLLEGMGYTNSFFQYIGKGWGFTVSGIVILLFALYLGTAWVRFSSDRDFIFYVNGQAIAHERQVLYHSLGLANRRSERLQRINDSIPYRSRGYDWIHISIPNNWKLATYLDITPYLHPGKNTIALEIQKGKKNTRVVLEGAVSPVEGTGATINLSTGATEWKVSNLSENRQGLLWFHPAFPDESWPDAKIIGPVQEAIYSRVSQHLFDRPLTANWITGTESEQGQVWLRGSWKVTAGRQRAFIRLAGDGEYSLLINGLLVNRFPANDRNQLYMYEVTNFLHPGENTLAVRLARNLDPDWTGRTNGAIVQNDTLDFLLDGWVENSKGEIVDAIATNNSWISLTEPIPGWEVGAGSGQTATIIGPPDRQEFKRRFVGNAYLLNYPDHLLHQSLWILGGIGCTFVYTWSLGQFWLGRDRGWDSLAAGAGLLLPGTLFLIAEQAVLLSLTITVLGWILSIPGGIVLLLDSAGWQQIKQAKANDIDVR